MESNRGTSFPEQALFFFIKKHFPDALNRYKIPHDDRNVEIDVYIPSICVGIEYDGAYWHKGKVDMDLEKNRILYENGVHLIRIREKGLPALSSHNAMTISLKHSPDGKNGNAVIASFINDTLKIIYEQFQNTPPKSEPYLTTEEYLSEMPSIYATMFSKAVNDNICNYCGIGYWNYSKNGTLKPENIPANSWAFAFLKCPNGEDIVLPGSWFRLNLDKRTCTHICSQCLFDCLCPFIVNCYLQKGYRPVHCQYIEDKTLCAIKQGIAYKGYFGESNFLNFLFWESDCGIKIIESFLANKNDSIYRENVLRFLDIDPAHYRIINIPAWTQKDLGLIKAFDEELGSNIVVNIRDGTKM